MFCKKCGYKLCDSDYYCPFCGTKREQSEVKKEETPKVENQPISQPQPQESHNFNEYRQQFIKTHNDLGFMKIGTKWLHHALIACIGYFAMYILIMIISSFMIAGYASQGIDFTCIVENENFVEACPADVVNAYMMASSVSQLVGEFAVIAIVIIIFAKYLKPMFKHFIENKCYIWYLIGIGILYGGNIIYSIILDILQLNSTSSNQDGVNEIIFNAPFVGFLFVVIAAPLFEEIIFRFGVFRAFTHGSKKKAIIGLVLTTLIFAGVHMIATVQEVWADPAAPDYELLKSDLLTLPVYLIGAFGLTFVYYKSKNIMTSMLVHMTYNGLAFLSIMQLAGLEEETTQCIINLVRFIFKM